MIAQLLIYLVLHMTITHNRPYQPLQPQGWVIHATAGPGQTAIQIRNWFDTTHVAPEEPSSAHYIVDWTSVINMIPENEVAWHAGYTANHRFLSVEICEPVENDPLRYQRFQQAWDRAVWLVADRCVQYGWGVDKIFSHQEISNLYHESNHQDPVAFFAEYGKTMNDFRNAVQAEINLIKAPQTYTVVRGDSLWAIANRFDITVGDLRVWNGIWDNNLYVGQVLKIAPTPITVQ